MAKHNYGRRYLKLQQWHYCDAIMGTVASQVTSLTIVYTTVYSDADQRKHKSSALLAFVWGIHRGPVNSPHKGAVTRKMFPFDDVTMTKYIGLPGLSKGLNPWWRHQMETFLALLVLCEENPPVTRGFPSQMPVTWISDDFLICA